MEKKLYKVVAFEGDYALLQRCDAPSDNQVFIARALLPQDADVGSTLLYEMFSYSIV